MPLFEPSEDQRRTVKALSGYGVPQDGIAIHIGVDPKTLRKHFRDELDRGSVEATAKVAQTLFHLATVEKNVPSVIFWMKARAGWREKHQVEVTAGPLQSVSDEDLTHHMIEILKECIEQEDAAKLVEGPDTARTGGLIAIPALPNAAFGRGSSPIDDR